MLGNVAVTGWVLMEDRCPSRNVVATILLHRNARHGMRRGLEARAHEGRQRAVTVPKGQPVSLGSKMARERHPQERGPQPP